MPRLLDFLGRGRDADQDGDGDAMPASGVLQEEQQDNLESDMSILDDGDGARGLRVHKEAEREVRTAAEDSLKKLHVIQMGRCPVCGDHLRRHLFASICESCGWHTFDMPRSGPVRVHLLGGAPPVEGERCYVIKGGVVLVVKNDLVIARVPASSCAWVEYVWSDEEIDQRHRQVVERMEIGCGWCGKTTDPNADGFHLVHVAFGASQERYCMCSDECFEAFRKMYPARVHRNCYERNCAECTLCIKRYGDEAEGIRMIAKDFLAVRKKK